MSGAALNGSFPSASSSSQSSPDAFTPDASDRGELDDLAHDADAGGNALHELDSHLSFKRKSNRSSNSNSNNKHQNSSRGRPAGSSSSSQHLSPSSAAAAISRGGLGISIPGSAPSSSTSSSKNGGPGDWSSEGPGRRVGYEDMTAIDWIFESTKERQRLRVLSSSAGSDLVRYIHVLVDASQVWIVLLLTGLAVGAIAAAIDVTTDWLADLKLGYCHGGPEGGQFYLNKGFCCYGYDQGSHCVGWRPWSEALGVHSLAGKWFIEYFLFIVLSTVLAGFAALLVQDYAIYAKHSGIPEVKTILGGFVMRKFLDAWTLVTKSFGLVLSVSSGMWLGKEGPLVHVACCCGNLFMKLFKNINDNEARKRGVLSAAAASGISVAFGSPIGGVLFSLEQLSYFFPDKTMWQSFVCAMSAAVVLQIFDPFRSGKLVLYQTRYSRDWHGFELFPYALLGVFGGVYGGLFIKLNMAVARWKKTQTWIPGPIMQVLAVAVLTALVDYPNHYMKFQTSELVSNLVAECSKVLDDQVGICKTGAASASTIVLLLSAAVVGFFLATITFGLQIPAGILLPSMAIGALVGRAMGILVEILANAFRASPLFFSQCLPDVPCVTPGTYAIVGAAAALTGVTRMTVSIVVIMLELTGAITYVLPIMIAVMISKWVGDAFSRHSIYEAWIHINGYPFLDNSEELLIPDMPTSQIMTRIEDLVVLSATGHTIASLRTILDMHPYRGFPVISDPRRAVLLGYISRAELRFNIQTASAARSLPPETEVFFAHQPLADPHTTLDLRPWMDQTPLTLPSRTNLHLVVTYFQKLGLRYMLFTDKGTLQGLLTKKDAWYVLEGEEEEEVATRSNPGHVRGASRASSRAGFYREDGDGEERGLLRMDDDAASFL